MRARGVPGADDEREGVGVDGDGAVVFGIGLEGDDAELEEAEVELLGDFAGEGAMHGDVDRGVLLAKGVEDGEQVEAGVFVGGELEAAALERLELLDGGGGFAAEGEQAQGVFAQQLAGRGEGAVAGGAVEEDFAD